MYTFYILWFLKEKSLGYSGDVTKNIRLGCLQRIWILQICLQEIEASLKQVIFWQFGIVHVYQLFFFFKTLATD